MRDVRSLVGVMVEESQAAMLILPLEGYTAAPNEEMGFSSIVMMPMIIIRAHATNGERICCPSPESLPTVISCPEV